MKNSGSHPGSPSSELLDVLRQIGPHEHLALLYESKEEQFAAAIPAIRVGIERHEKCVYVADDNTAVDVIDALRDGGIDVGAAVESGSLTVATRQDTTLKEGRFVPETLLRFWADAVEASTAAGFSGLRIVAEMTWSLHGDPGTEQLIEFEAKVNDLVRRRPIVAICQYNRRRFSPEVILNVIRVHPLVFFDGLLCRNPYYIPPQEFLGRHHAEMEVERLLENLRERKQAEDRIRLVIDAIPTMAWSLRPNGDVDFVNQRWMEYTGLSFEDAITGSTDIVHPEDLSRAVEKWLKDMAAEKPSEDEMRLRRADGEYRWFLIRTVPQLDEEGKIVKWYGTSTDIEDRKQAEEALRKSEKLFAVFMDQLPGFAWMKDIEGRYVYVNKKESELDAYRAGAIGKTDAELWPAEIASAYRANDRQVITTRKAVQVVEPSLAGGELYSMLVSKFPIFDQNGSVVMVAGAGVDITDRIQAEEALRESEARTRLLIKSSNIGLWDWNLVTDDVFYTPEWKSQLGYANDEVPGRYEEWENRLHPEDREPSLRAVQDFREGRREVYDVEFRLRHKDGSWRSILSRADLICDAAGQPVRMLGCHIDITERKQAERQVEHFAELFQALSHRLLDVQEEERRHLARELHDEIGQALTAAKLNLKIIAPEVPPAAVGRLEDSMQILDRLLQQVRQLSLDLRPPLLDELGLVPALRWLADQQAQLAGLRVLFTANVDHLEMDPLTRTACFRVAQEAITNAIRHARAATVAVELRAEANRVWLVVKDDGGGFDKDAMQQRAARGASIGLLSMNERASLLGGELEVTSAPDRGTEIRAWFPLAPPGPEATRVS
jgi:PAS domain S-box-containing protein